MARQPALVEVERVTQSYGSGARRFVAVRDVNLRLDEGEFVALLGPSGSGKSTLLRIIAGLQQPTDGQVLYRGKRLEGVNPHTAIVFQTFALFPWLTVSQNVQVALEARGMAQAERATRAEELLDRVGLDGFERAFPRELSGGMRQKVGFARAMAVEPELLCLDEPFSALDVLSAETLRGELLELWTTGKLPTKAILMVTHNIEEGVFMADRIVVFDKNPGRVAAEMAVGLPHPRQRKSPEFVALVDRVYGLLAGHTETEQVELGTAPGEPGPTRLLPDVRINDLAGLLERINEQPGDRTDVYKLGGDLGLDLDSLLPSIEAAELLGFATVAQGDIALTSLGETFADASILARKEIFATRLRRLPLFRWLLGLLKAASDDKLEREVVLAALGLEFPPEAAEEQLEILADWGRYAELVTYDDHSGVFGLEG
jgi:NitT/TauT family transport system ATP-binding protein